MRRAFPWGWRIGHWHVLAAVVTVVLALPGSAAAAPVLTSVTFGGSPSAPEVTVSGSGFGTQPPAGQPAYPGYTGEDFASALYLCDTSSHPHAFCAGQNNGGGGDTIGLVVKSYTDRQIVLALGSDYGAYYYPSGVYRLQPGDAFAVSVAGATCHGTIAFAGAPIACAGSSPCAATRMAPRARTSAVTPLRPTGRRRAGSRAHSPARTILGAVARTSSRRARRFDLAIALSPGLARYLAMPALCGQVLRGTGYVNFRQRAARWALTLPSVFRGDLRIIAVGARTFVHAPQFTRGRRRHPMWIALDRPADYRSFDRLTILRDLVVLTNPLRSLGVLEAAGHPRRQRGRAATAIAAAAAADASDGRITAPCARNAHPVASNDEVDPRQLYAHLTLGSTMSATETGLALRAWSQTTVDASADKSGVCQLSVAVQNANTDGFDVVITFTDSSPPDPQVQGPQTTATASWDTVYHVSQPPCLDGTWETSFTQPLGGSGTGTVTARAVISGQDIEWSRDFSSVLTTPYELSNPDPPYTPITTTDTTRTTSDYDSATGVIVGMPTAGVTEYSTDVSGLQVDQVQDSLGTYPPGNATAAWLDRPVTLQLNCAAGTLTVEQNRTLSVGPPLTQTLHKVSAPPPQVTVTQNWRSRISAPVPAS